MKKLVFIIAIVSFFPFVLKAQSCLPEGIMFTTQAQIDSFQINYPDCTMLKGNVIINGADITNLDSLNGLTYIIGGLTIGWWIYENPFLVSLEGLNNLTYVGNLTIDHNPLLVDLSGLEGLTLIGGKLMIGTTWAKNEGYYSGNQSLTSLKGLDNLISIGEGITISGNQSLTSLKGLDDLISIGEGITISGNQSLTSLKGLDDLISIGEGILIEGNSSLKSIKGIANIDPGSIESLYIVRNHSLSKCETGSICSYLANPNGDVSIYDNAPGCNSQQEVEEDCENTCEGITFTSQAQIDSFPNNYPLCAEIEGSVKINGYDITNLNGLSNLTSISNLLSIFENPSLTELSGLANLGSVGKLKISNNASLISLNGLSNLTSLVGNVDITNNSALINLSGLEGLDTIRGLTISNNDALSSLSGLDNLTCIIGLGIWGSYLNIRENDALLSLNGLENLTSLSSGIDGWESYMIILGNDAMESLQGIEKIDAETVQRLFIIDNSSLSVCDTDWLCNILADTITYIGIGNNSPGCNSPEEVWDSCVVSVEERKYDLKVSIHPNPFKKTIAIEYKLQQTGTIQITIFDHLGKLVEMIEKKQAAGKQQFVWNAEGLPGGVYYCVMKTENTTRTVKMIKLK